MQDLHPQADKLLAYTDDNLNASERAEVEELLANDESAADFLQQLKASDLPFSKSFDFLLDENPQATSAKTPSSNLSRWAWPTSLVASLLFGLALGYFNFAKSTENHDNWIVQVADYQLLYVRETVKHSHLNSAEKTALKTKLGKKLNTKLNIPDLSAQKLEFKRGQLLDSNGQALVQLAYLPESGRPVALCVLRDNASDSLPKAGESRGLPYVTWAKNGLSYVIIGDINKQDLNAAALSALAQMANES